MTKHTTKLSINSGICECGHWWDEHHMSMICNKNAWDAIVAHVEVNYPGRIWKDSTGRDYKYPMYIPGECEHYGFNENGGMKPLTTNSDDPYDDHGKWEDHCYGYKDKDGPLETIEWEN